MGRTRGMERKRTEREIFSVAADFRRGFNLPACFGMFQALRICHQIQHFFGKKSASCLMLIRKNPSGVEGKQIRSRQSTFIPLISFVCQIWEILVLFAGRVGDSKFKFRGSRLAFHKFLHSFLFRLHCRSFSQFGLLHYGTFEARVNVWQWEHFSGRARNLHHFLASNFGRKFFFVSI